MKFLNTSGRLLLVFLLMGVAINILWSLRLEGNAQQLSAKVMEHHGMLSQNKDVLSTLDVFMRSVGGAAGINSIILNKEGITLDAGIDTKVSILNKDYIRIKKGKAVILVGKGAGHKEGVAMGSMFSAVKGSTIAASEKGIAMTVLDTGSIMMKAGKGKGQMNLIIDPQKERIELKKGKSVVRVGKGTYGEGIEFGVFHTGTIAITEGKGIGIKAKGNISILSDTGDVKINGKTVRLNE